MENKIQEVEPPIRIEQEVEPSIRIVSELRDSNVRENYSNLDLLKMHNVKFIFMDAGCTISVGCKTYAFSSNEEGLSEFAKLVENPKKAWEKWNN